jgi:hypothetical protein
MHRHSDGTIEERRRDMRLKRAAKRARGEKGYALVNGASTEKETK